MHRSKGFTLIEMVLVIVILGIVAAGSAFLLQQTLASYVANQDINNATSQASIALETMSRRLREIRSSADITTATATQLTFTDINNSTVTYQISGGNLLLNGSVLASGVDAASSFTYLGANANTTAILANIRYISVNLVIVQNNVTYSLRTIIYPRNLS